MKERMNEVRKKESERSKGIVGDKNDGFIHYHWRKGIHKKNRTHKEKSST
jgi:hypothetical protein